jgi:serine/threonine protein kinase
MEFIDGICVTDLIVYQKKLTEPMAAHLTKQILSGLRYLHQNNIVHRDIKVRIKLFFLGFD